MSQIAIVRREQFNAAHRLYNKNWTDEKNDAVFGLCNNANFHGHNYILEVKVSGEIDPETGYVIDLKILKDLIRNEVVERFDHKNLNEDTEEFKNLNPTVENIAVVIYHILRSKLAASFDLHIKLFETERNWVEYPVK